MLVVDMGSNEPAALSLISTLRRNVPDHHLPATLLAGHDISKVKPKLEDVVVLRGSPLDSEGLLTTVLLHVQPHAVSPTTTADPSAPSLG
jgi:hypothetical protein